MEKKIDEMLEFLQETPIVAAIKDFNGLARCVESESNMVFILFGDICNIAQIVETVKAAGKLVIVHIDLIDGLANRTPAVDYIKAATKADGIISTKPALIKYAKSLGMLTIQRFFLIDSMALENVMKQIDLGYADLIEVLPGVMPKIIKKIVSNTKIPTIAGGLICDKEDIVTLLSAGAVAISSTNTNVWFM